MSEMSRGVALVVMGAKLLALPMPVQESRVRCGIVADWGELSARASMASHRLIGWIYWDPVAIERYTALGVEDGFGYYIASRGAPLAPAGHQAVSAAFYSILPAFIQGSL